MQRKTSAYYQGLYRQRLRDQGLVKKEVWILPDNAPHLLAVEKRLRQPQGLISEVSEGEMSMAQVWTAETLYEALAATEPFAGDQAGIELIQGSEPSLHLTMYEYGDLPLFAAVVGEQLVIEGLLWPATDVRDVTRFNEEILRTHKLFPLSSIGLETMPNGQDCYIMFGALSATSTLPNVVLEVELLADNIIKATEAYEDFLTTTA